MKKMKEDLKTLVKDFVAKNHMPEKQKISGYFDAMPFIVLKRKKRIYKDRYSRWQEFCWICCSNRKRSFNNVE